jgi:hypothetical protein
MPDGAYLGDAAMQAFAEVSAVPAWVGEINNVPDWELATLYWLVRRSDLALVSVWSPTFFVRLLDGLDRHGEALLALLTHGGEHASRTLPADKPAFERLSFYFRERDSRLLWPSMKLIAAGPMLLRGFMLVTFRRVCRAFLFRVKVCLPPRA